MAPFPLQEGGRAADAPPPLGASVRSGPSVRDLAINIIGGTIGKNGLADAPYGLHVPFRSPMSRTGLALP